MEALDKNQLKPVEHPGLIRLGARRDGGYVVPEAQVRNSAVLLSLGMNTNWSFDRDFVSVNAGARVIGVDPSVGPLFFIRRLAVHILKVLGHGVRGDRRKVRKDLAVLHTSFDYFAFFAAPHRHIRKRVARDNTTSVINVTRLLDIACVERDHGVFLKMDIEGSEYAIVSDIVTCERRINCIVAEFHDLTGRVASFNRSIRQLLEHFRIVHVHGNNYGAYDRRNDFPDSVEITLVNKACIDESPALSQREYPWPDLDFPNRPNRPDYPLHFD